MQQFKVYPPKSVKDAMSYLADHSGACTIIMDGNPENRPIKTEYYKTIQRRNP